MSQMNDEAQLLHQASHRLGESILWHEARQTLYWTDLFDPGLFQMTPGGPLTHTALDLPPPIGSAAATTDPGKLILLCRSGLLLLDLGTMAFQPYCDPEQGRDAIIYNDLKCDRFGRLWVGTSHALEREARGALWGVKDRRRWQLGDAGFPVSNGPAFSPDGRLMYFNDSFNRQTFVYDISEDSLLPENRRLLASYSEEEGMPDGLTVDAEGCIWTAQWAGARVIRLSPKGEKLQTVHVPSGHVTSVCLGGKQRRELFITTATDGLSPDMLKRYPQSGSVFRFTADAPGLPEPLCPR